MANLRIKGDTSGYVDLLAPDVAGSQVINLERVVTTDANGNLGVGTVTPSAGLDLVKDTNPVLKVSRGTDNAANINLYYNTTFMGQLSGAAGAFQISAAGATTPMEFFTNGEKRFEIKENGNVGIGTADANYKFHVHGTNGNGTATAFIDEWGIIGNRYSGNTLTKLNWAGGTPGARIQGYEGTTQKFEISANSQTYFNGGNVGIGTNNPPALLGVHGAEFLANFNATDVEGGWIKFQTQGTTIGHIGSAAQLQTTGGAGDFTIRAEAGQALTFSIADGERARINSIGYMGLGTDSPQDKLHIQGGRIMANVSDNWQQSSLGTHLFRAGAFGTTITNETNTIKLYPASTSRAAGNYWGGISLMHLNPEESTWGTSYQGAQIWLGGKIYDTPGQERSSFVIATNPDSAAGSHPVARLVIDPFGNVGIGSDTPGNWIDVKKNDEDSDYYLRYEKANDNGHANGHTASGLIIGGQASSSATKDPITYLGLSSRDSSLSGVHGTGAYMVLSTPDDQSVYGTGQIDFYIRHSAPYTFPNNPQTSSQYWMDSKFTIKSNGNVGINTTSPRTLQGLDINGGLRIDPVAEPNNITGGDYIVYQNKQTNQDWGIFSQNDQGTASDYGIRIDTSSSASYAFAVSNGSYVFRVTGAGTSLATSHSSISDSRLKENVTTLSGSLDKILSLRGVNFTWIDRPDEGTQLGFIAQEVEEHVPELVQGDDAVEVNLPAGETDILYKHVDYGKLTPLLVEAIKELKAENDALKARLDAAGL